MQRNTIHSRQYFWRSYSKQEVDLIEETGTNINGFEIKFKQANFKVPSSFSKDYPSVTITTINRENIDQFILSDLPDK